MLEIKLFVVNAKEYVEGIWKPETITLPADEKEIDKVLNRITNNGENNYLAFVHETELPVQIENTANIQQLNSALKALIELQKEKQLSDEEIYAIVEYYLDLNEAVEALEKQEYMFVKLERGTMEELAEVLVSEHGWFAIPVELFRFIDWNLVADEILANHNDVYIANNNVAIICWSNKDGSNPFFFSLYPSS